MGGAEWYISKCKVTRLAENSPNFKSMVATWYGGHNVINMLDLLPSVFAKLTKSFH